MLQKLLALSMITTACAATVADVPARREDVGSIDGIVAAYYEVVNLAPDAPRQWARDRTLYSPWIRFVGVGRGEGGRPKVTVRTHQQLIDETEALMARGFRERELFREVRRYGNTAQVRSAYEGELAGDPPITFRGVNNLELYFDGDRWWIAGVTWQAEDDLHPIPAELLPAGTELATPAAPP